MPDVLAGGRRVGCGIGMAGIFAPLIGGIGAFVAGSNTISNMMFSLFQFGVAQKIGADPTWVVALASGRRSGRKRDLRPQCGRCLRRGRVGRPRRGCDPDHSLCVSVLHSCGRHAWE